MKVQMGGLEVTGESLPSLPEALVWVDRAELLESCCPGGVHRVSVGLGKGREGRAGWSVGESEDGLEPRALLCLCPSPRLTAETFVEEWLLHPVRLPNLTRVPFLASSNSELWGFWET